MTELAERSGGGDSAALPERALHPGRILLRRLDGDRDRTGDGAARPAGPAPDLDRSHAAGFLPHGPAAPAARRPAQTGGRALCARDPALVRSHLPSLDETAVPAPVGEADRALVAPLVELGRQAAAPRRQAAVGAYPARRRARGSLSPACPLPAGGGAHTDRDLQCTGTRDRCRRHLATALSRSFDRAPDAGPAPSTSTRLRLPAS